MPSTRRRPLGVLVEYQNDFTSDHPMLSTTMAASDVIAQLGT